MSAVFDAVSDVVSSVSDSLADFDDTVRDVATDVATTVNTTIDNALRDPIGTIVTVGTAILAPELLPVVQGAKVLDNGGSLEDALLAAGATYIGGQVASEISGNVGGGGEAFVDSSGAIQTTPIIEPSGVAGATGSQTAGNIAGQLAGATTKGALTGQDVDLGQLATNIIGSQVVGGATNEIMNETGGVGGFIDKVADALGLTDEESTPTVVPKEVDQAAATIIASALTGQDPTMPLANLISNQVLNEGLDLVTGQEIKDVPITSLVKPQEPDAPVAPPAPVTPPPSGIATLPTDTPPATEGGITTIPATGTPSTPVTPTTPEVVPPVTTPVTPPVTTPSGIGALDTGALASIWPVFSSLSKTSTTASPTGVIGGIPTTTALPYGDSTSLPYG